MVVCGILISSSVANQVGLIYNANQKQLRAWHSTGDVVKHYNVHSGTAHAKRPNSQVHASPTESFRSFIVRYATRLPYGSWTVVAGYCHETREDTHEKVACTEQVSHYVSTRWSRVMPLHAVRSRDLAAFDNGHERLVVNFLHLRT